MTNLLSILIRYKKLHFSHYRSLYCKDEEYTLDGFKNAKFVHLTKYTQILMKNHGHFLF